MKAKFGPAGNPDLFYQSGYKASSDMPVWLAGLKLAAYEYQCSRGVNIKEETAREIGENARIHGISLSIHAPYYISLATDDPDIAVNTRNHLLKSLTAATWMGADRVVFHIGGAGKNDRRDAMKRAKALFASVLEEAAEQGLNGVYLAPETMGKQSQLGNIEEVLEFCAMSEQVIPTIDFGHLHAVSGGKYTDKAEYDAVFERIGAVLGERGLKNLHIHFSRIEFTKGGERRHWTFDDDYGPPHEPMLESIVDLRLTPRIICESAGTQAADARVMQEFYWSLLNTECTKK